MSYRTFKKILGETSLERKCRFLFGVALLLLITGSFYFYAQLNLGVLRNQHRQRAELLIDRNLERTHLETIQVQSDPETVFNIKELVRALKPDDLYNWKFLPADGSDALRQPSAQFEHDALNDLVFKKKTYVTYEDKEAGHYHVFGAIIAREECMRCHRDQGIAPKVQEVGEVMGASRLTFSLEEIRSEIARNNAVLVAMAIITVFLAMLVAYVIVRYVIVKPVMHLKDVSDAIAHGDLDQRADIRTGDEFQELSHAYNRMLRHLVTTQEELRQVNVDLDAKVDELARANLSLHEMNKIKNEFLATMSHELRTPLNSILGFSDVLGGADNLSEKQRKYLSNISNSGKNLLTLINDILDLAKIEAGRMEVHVTEFSVEDLLERLTSAMLPLAEKKNIDMQWEVDERLPILNQDVGKLQQILYNLLSNAIKFTPEGGRIRVAVQAIGQGHFDLVVADSGIGIPLDDQAVIFEKFRQGQNQRDDALTRQYEGTGLGLSIVKELSKLLGGEVLLESEFGKGSTFTVRLPISLTSQTRFGDVSAPAAATHELLRQAAAYGVSEKRDAS